MRLVIFGASGFLGQALTRFFTHRGSEVICVNRTVGVSITQEYTWRDDEAIVKALNGSTGVINLAGKSVNCRYTAKNKQAILESRVNTTHKIGGWLARVNQPPKIWLNASTATIYRHAADRAMTEADGEIGDDFSMQVAKHWESAFFTHKRQDIRQVALRTSIVMGNSGGALLPLKNLVKMGLGGKMGSGKQMVSWLHIDDFCRAVAWIIDHPAIEGPVNITAPEPVTNTMHMAMLKMAFRMPIGLPAPEWLLRWGAWVIGTETELILKSRWVVPEILLKSGFHFTYPNFKAAALALADANNKL